MNVVCTWWTGLDGGPGQYPYSEDYVHALRSQIPGLIVLSDNGYRPLLQPRRYKGWWSKIEVFRPENRDLRPCLCVDLDTLILGDITPILNLDPERLWLIRDFNRPNKGESGLFIAPKDGISDVIWKGVQQIPNLTRGDGAFLRRFECGYIQDEVDGILSYKTHKLQDEPRGRVVCFHGKPKPHECKGWAHDLWTYQSSVSRSC